MTEINFSNVINPHMSKKDMWETENVTHKVILNFLWCPGFRLQLSSLKVQLQPHETPCLAGCSESPKNVIKIFTLGERIEISKGCFVPAWQGL